ncbi:MAG TPA: type II toxin-antitoxin system PemK/MazF family toxin [Dehalococcoidales bacterium]|nr:type II toxin-antitoxin system PemK/MazF family toxin [Dehalococcoidales bacterium]
MPNFQWAVFEANLNPVTGAEQKGRRPVLVISNEEFNQAMPNVTVLPLTSTKRRLYPSEILLPEGRAGLSLESIVMAHQIRTISKERLGKLLGLLEDTQLQHEIQRAIKDHLDIE